MQQGLGGSHCSLPWRMSSPQFWLQLPAGPLTQPALQTHEAFGHEHRPLPQAIVRQGLWAPAGGAVGVQKPHGLRKGQLLRRMLVANWIVEPEVWRSQ